MHGGWDAMDLAGNAEDCAPPPENYKPCNLAGKACSVTGCRPYTAPCNLASAPLRLGHGLSPYKKAKKQIFLRERVPDEICFYLFCMACSFREKSACIMEKGMVD